MVSFGFGVAERGFGLSLALGVRFGGCGDTWGLFIGVRRTMGLQRLVRFLCWEWSVGVCGLSGGNCLPGKSRWSLKVRMRNCEWQDWPT